MPGEQEEIAVQFRDVAKTYDGKLLVVDDLNLNIQSGEFVTLLGPSGSGKTTTLMMLAGFEPPTRGSISFNGEDITTIAPHKRGMGMVFQNYALFPHMTVGENIAYPLRVRGENKADRHQKVLDALDMVKLKGFEKRRPNQLSGGERQRVALARALVFRPSLVLMDEPLGALDKNLREHMQYEIRAIHARLGVTVVYVTHDQSEALTMSNRIAVFSAGKIQQIDSPDALYEKPNNAFVAGFIGENNALKAAYIRSAGGDSDDAQFGLISEAGGTGADSVQGGAEVSAVAVDCLRDAGVACLLSIRPERLVVNPDAGSCENNLAAVVKTLIYHGDHIRIVAEAASTGGELVVKSPPNIPPPAVGENVTLGWRTSDCRAFASQ
ncbi:MAG: ABC transporter ATP-binding protein [Alphaproteobacteria bacterium]|nr:ABC transporter ATP-binding protein [Alphaproteobacteria bacterium]